MFFSFYWWCKWFNSSSKLFFVYPSILQCITKNTDFFSLPFDYDIRISSIASVDRVWLSPRAMKKMLGSHWVCFDFSVKGKKSIPLWIAIAFEIFIHKNENSWDVWIQQKEQKNKMPRTQKITDLTLVIQIVTIPVKTRNINVQGILYTER